MAILTITATIQDAGGAPLAGASLQATLCNYGSQVPQVNGVALLGEASPKTAAASAAGLATLQLYGNDAIVPAGTFYAVQVIDAQGNVCQTNAYRLTGTGPVDLSNLTQYNPTPAPIPPVTGNFIRLPYIGTPQFLLPALGYVTFGMLLTGDVTASTFSATPTAGQIVAFLISQDTVGGHAFAFPSTVIDPAPVASYGNAKTFQAFIAGDDGNLYPFGVASTN